MSPGATRRSSGLCFTSDLSSRGRTGYEVCFTLVADAKIFVFTIGWPGLRGSHACRARRAGAMAFGFSRSRLRCIWRRRLDYPVASCSLLELFRPAARQRLRRYAALASGPRPALLSGAQAATRGASKPASGDHGLRSTAFDQRNRLGFSLDLLGRESSAVVRDTHISSLGSNDRWRLIVARARNFLSRPV